jgi:DNA-binding transcriptional MerR regulator
MDKSPDAFRTISEVADVLETPAHVLRFWESRFPQIKPVKRAGGRRYYRPSDVALLAGIRRLLHAEGLTIRGVQKILRDQGARHVASLSDDSVLLGAVVAQARDLDETSLMAALGSSDQDSAAPESAKQKGAKPPGATATPAAPALSEADIDALELAGDPEALADLVAALGPEGSTAELPLFAAAAATAPIPSPTQAPIVAPSVPLAPRKPTLHDDKSFASLIRALPAESLLVLAPEISPLARRLAALRARCAERADGGLV